MLQRQDLTAIAQRALCKQTNFRQTIEHDALRLDPLHCFENAICRFSQL